MPRRSEFTKILLAAFTSQSGSHFLTLSLSAFVLASTQSVSSAALIFVLSYFPAMFASSRVGSWIDRSLTKGLLAGNELVSIIASAACGLAIFFETPLWVLCLVVSFRSLLLFISRAAMSKWIKLISPESLQASRIKLFFFVFFLSTAASGILAGAILGGASILTVVAIDIATYCVGVGFILSLERLPKSAMSEATVQRASIWATVREIGLSKQLRLSFLTVCFSQALFQGAYSVMVSYLPVRHFNLGIGGTGIFQLAASFGIIGGFILLWRLPYLLADRDRRLPARVIVTAMIAATGLLSLAKSNLTISVVAFLAMNLAYECIWLFHSSEFFKRSPEGKTACYQLTLSSCAAFLMAALTLSYSFAIEHFGPAGVGIVLGVGIICWIVVTYVELPKRVHNYSLGVPR